MNRYLECLISDDKAAEAYRLIDCISKGPGFSIDLDGKLKHQWAETCCNQLFEAWFVRGVTTGTIRAVDHSLPQAHKKKLRLDCGFPYNQRHEGVYVEVAHVTEEKVIVAEDIDFWSPKDKHSGAERRAELMQGGKGEVCKYLRDHLGIRVFTIQQALDHLGC